MLDARLANHFLQIFRLDDDGNVAVVSETGSKRKIDFWQQFSLKLLGVIKRSPNVLGPILNLLPKHY